MRENEYILPSTWEYLLAHVNLNKLPRAFRPRKFINFSISSFLYRLSPRLLPAKQANYNCFIFLLTISIVFYIIWLITREKRPYDYVSYSYASRFSYLLSSLSLSLIKNTLYC